ncbi:MAG: NUDIX hydrolase [Hyphomicrobiaceae bacterium]|nr:NUDIX hydrolase [Hyphomicrobiaceae bacterium]
MTTPPVSSQPQFETRVPAGDTLERRVCASCGFVDYENPRIVVGAVVRVDDKILLCRRAIEPRLGFWTLPAGYLELGETPEEGVRREAREEACADLTLGPLLAVYTIRPIGQVQLIYRATLQGDFAAGPESLEVRLFDWADIPWADLAFQTVEWALHHDRAIAEGRAAGIFGNAAA